MLRLCIHGARAGLKVEREGTRNVRPRERLGRELSVEGAPANEELRSDASKHGESEASASVACARYTVIAIANIFAAPFCRNEF